MLCPRCGYLMSALDNDCARCRNFGVTSPPAASNGPRASASPPAGMTEWNAPAPQARAFMPMNAAPPAGQAAPVSSYAPPVRYAPYPPAVPICYPPTPSRAAQFLGGVGGVLLIIGWVCLRIYLIEARQQRRDAAMLNLNARYNDTMRRQFDTMQMQGQMNAQQAQQDVSDAMQNGSHGMSGVPSSTTAFVNPQSGPSAQMMMQQQMMQQQMMQQQMQMQSRMTSNHGGMGGFGR